MSERSSAPWMRGRSTAIRSEFERRRHEIPVPTELLDHPSKPEMTIKTKWLSFIVQFHKERLTVDAELSLAAKMLATNENRRSRSRSSTASPTT